METVLLMPLTPGAKTVGQAKHITVLEPPVLPVNTGTEAHAYHLLPHHRHQHAATTPVNQARPPVHVRLIVAVPLLIPPVLPEHLGTEQVVFLLVLLDKLGMGRVV